MRGAGRDASNGGGVRAVRPRDRDEPWTRRGNGAGIGAWRVADGVTVLDLDARDESSRVRGAHRQRAGAAGCRALRGKLTMVARGGRARRRWWCLPQATDGAPASRNAHRPVRARLCATRRADRPGDRPERAAMSARAARELVRASWRTAKSYRLSFVLSFAALVVTIIPVYFVATALQPFMASVIADE